jgi:hypothetical protein
MEERATAHTADNCRNALAEVCSERAVKKRLWPSRSPDLYPCVFCLRCTLNKLHCVKILIPYEKGTAVTPLQKRCRLDTFFNFVRHAWQRKFSTRSSCQKKKSSHSTAGVHKFPKISKPPQNSRHLKDNTKQVPY